MGSPAPTTRAARPAPCAAAAAQPGCGPAERARPSDCPASRVDCSRAHGRRSAASKCELTEDYSTVCRQGPDQDEDNFRCRKELRWLGGLHARERSRFHHTLGRPHTAQTLDTLATRAPLTNIRSALSTQNARRETRHDDTKPDCCVQWPRGHTCAGATATLLLCSTANGSPHPAHLDLRGARAVAVGSGPRLDAQTGVLDGRDKRLGPRPRRPPPSTLSRKLQAGELIHGRAVAAAVGGSTSGSTDES